MERAGRVTFQGNPLTLLGKELQVGDTAPDFTVLNQELKPVKLSDFKGKTIIISSVPSLDTPVCALQTQRFNQEAAKRDLTVLTISMDLPFAQKRFCDSYKIGSIQILSDYKDRVFGSSYGLLIKELGLLARAVLIIDPQGKVIYQEIVKEISQEPNYGTILKKI